VIFGIVSRSVAGTDAGGQLFTVVSRRKEKTHVDMFSSGMPAMQEALFAGLACDSLPKETRNR